MDNGNIKLSKTLQILTRVNVVLLILWVSVISGSLIWNLRVAREETKQISLNVARAYYSKDLAFRLWGAGHGGVYVPVTEQTKPNPYLQHIPERDIITESGRKLTLMNPAFMIRQMLDSFRELTGVSGHLVSLKQLNPINAPDEWERKGLELFETGVPEITEFVGKGDSMRLRLMRPFITKKQCLKCHEFQGYKVGDVRGATSISIPLNQYLQLEKAHAKIVIITHGFILLLGLIGIYFSFMRIKVFVNNRFQMEENLKRQTDFTRKIIESLTHPFVVLDANSYEIILANSAAAQGKNSDGLMCYQLNHARTSPCDGNEHPCPLELVKEKKQNVTVDHVHFDKEGQQQDVEIQCYPIFDKQGNVSQVIEYCYDVTERKKAEKEHLKLQNQLRQAQKMEAIGALAGGIAHDFNNMLSGIIGFAQLAEMQPESIETQQNAIASIKEAGYRAADLVKQILTFSRKSEQKKIALHVHNLVKETITLIRASTPTSMEIENNIEAHNDVIFADPSQIHQLLMNLCTNAIHAMGEKGHLAISTENVTMSDTDLVSFSKDVDHGEFLKLSVSDTGVGIDKKILEQIFEPFFTTKSVGEGTGMGLSVVHGIVESHAGVIKVDSEPSKGTTFDVYFPTRIYEDTSKTNAVASMPKGNETILFVDDEKLLTTLGEETLKSLGYKVIVQTDSREALDCFQKNHDIIDLVITDQSMPNLTGKELAKKILKIREDIPIIICTGHSETLTKEEAKTIGIKAFRAKPFVGPDMAQTVRKLLSRDHND